jgi:histone acetyltransferase (RNA polymerase elongator complex component)
MVGLPGEDSASAVETSRKVAELAPSFVRIYPTLVIAGSPLADLYRKGDYRPLSLEKSVQLVKTMYLAFAAVDIPVIRMGIQPTDGLADKVMAGPFHPAFGQLVLSAVFLEKAKLLLNGRRVAGKTLYFWVNSRSVSTMRGQRNDNIEALKEQFRPSAVRVRVDAALGEYDVRVSVV